MKRALIVDDSRLARHVLSRLLSEHGVEADTAESAEAALDYLRGHRPDVVFLDHLMPGMDGFQALEAIKANPVTATIPVMMYTSKEGEVYLGQARALGALGVLPKNVEPVEVAKVLRSLHLIPTGGEPEPGVPPAPPSTQALDARQLREVLQDLFYGQTSALRDELRRELQRLPSATPPAPPLEPRPVDRLRPHVFTATSAVLLIAAGVFAYLYFTTNALLVEAHQRTRELTAAASDLSDASTRAFQTLQTQDSARSQQPSRSVFELLQWGFNQGGRFAFGELPLDAERASALAELFGELRRMQFAGTVAIDVHMGRFCMSYGADGALELASANQAAAECERIGWSEVEAISMGEQQSLAFAYALANADSDLRIETASLGAADPMVSYPASPYAVTAGEWNAIAARNQRVELRLVPQSAAARSADSPPAR